VSRYFLPFGYETVFQLSRQAGTGWP